MSFNRISLIIVALALFASGCKASILEADLEASFIYQDEKIGFRMELPNSWYESNELSSGNEVVLTNLPRHEVLKFLKRRENDKSNWGFTPFFAEQRRMITFYKTENLSMYECVFEGKKRPECGELPEFEAFPTKGIPGLKEVTDQYFEHFIYFPVAQGEVLVVSYFPDKKGPYSEQYFEKMLRSLEVKEKDGS